MDFVPIYKCRSCGQLHEGTAIKGDLKDLALHNLVFKKSSNSLSMNSLHNCSRNVTGISDLIRVEPLGEQS